MSQKIGGELLQMSTSGLYMHTQTHTHSRPPPPPPHPPPPAYMVIALSVCLQLCFLSDLLKACSGLNLHEGLHLSGKVTKQCEDREPTGPAEGTAVMYDAVTLWRALSLHSPIRGVDFTVSSRSFCLALVVPQGSQSLSSSYSQTI